MDHFCHIYVQTVMVDGHAECPYGFCRRAYISDRRDGATTPPLDERESSLPYLARYGTILCVSFSLEIDSR